MSGTTEPRELMKGVFLFPERPTEEELDGQFFTTHDFEQASLEIGKIAQYGRETMQTIIRNNLSTLYGTHEHPLRYGHPVGNPILANRYRYGSSLNPGPHYLALGAELVRNTWLVREGYIPTYHVQRLGGTAHKLISLFFEEEKRARQELEDTFAAS